MQENEKNNRKRKREKKKRYELQNRMKIKIGRAVSFGSRSKYLLVQKKEHELGIIK